MKKLVLAAVAASALSAAAPAAATEAEVSTDPFASTAFLALPLLIVGGTFALITVAAASGT
ncbi:hypothetical protein [Poseidonocella sedimentorum]|uniref:Ferrochelatase n=1 Tax=Poseidonocella sedimentorum TaxID=871652 RepID=A0A1I6D8Y9_9RHOB|nr:hypothetical protein [Poseidonocella sedimentorum]SFR01831.1 hypothetical protein SAMN04515673_102427 [Poseidonocella sedimentorum]